MAEMLSLIAVVDDDSSMREAMKGLMRAVGFSVETFTSAESFLESADLFQIACLVADANLPGISGLELHHHLMANAINIPTIIITAYPREDLRSSSQDSGVLAYLVKPLIQDDLLSYVRSALDTKTS
ncbi:response regulator transcription factor [Inquilinus limosus]|uniref:Response regulatory domain-containing protein n=1 Tax=Inquilinus limosus TaxID=171674 RepID=A0A211ZVG9_9PROT|nr:response regulator [Inquilinus limosus]OWJ69067.1 hypothetical protein BWR60_00540 [Inquilinus limosus]